MAKYDKLCKLSKILHMKIDDIPINDSEAYSLNKKHNWVYNKLSLATYQGIECAPMPIKPTNYPVILKPIINLYGMSLHVSKLNNEKDFHKHWFDTHFWMEFLDGNHYSHDFIIDHGQVKYHVVFEGIKDPECVGKLGTGIFNQMLKIL